MKANQMQGFGSEPEKPSKAKGQAGKMPESFPEVFLGRGLTAQIVFITPELAKSLLETRDVDKQRTIKLPQVTMLIKEIQSGKMVLNGEPILISDEGEMIDGQHRATAVVVSGIGYWSLVVKGVDSEHFRTIDGGSKRSAAEALKSLQYANTNTLAGAALLVYRYECKALIDDSLKASSTVIVDVVRRHPGLVESVTATRMSRKICHGQKAAAFCHYLFGQIDRPMADEFFAKLATGEDMKKGDPILALRSRLMDHTTPVEVLAFLIKAWNAKRANRTLHFMKFGEGEEFPVAR